MLANRRQVPLRCGEWAGAQTQPRDISPIAESCQPFFAVFRREALGGGGLGVEVRTVRSPQQDAGGIRIFRLGLPCIRGRAGHQVNQTRVLERPELYRSPGTLYRPDPAGGHTCSSPCGA